MQTTFLIDGFNFYHSIKSFPKNLRWFNYFDFCKHFMRATDTLHSITYFTARAYWLQDSAARHGVFIDACKTLGVRVVEGKFKEKTTTCPICKKKTIRHEEKATDVNLALHAYRIAKYVEQIFLVTGDTDLVPAIKMIKQDYPSVKVGVIFPFNRSTRELKDEAHLTHKVSQKILGQFVLPQTLLKKDGTLITCPDSWR